MNYQRFKPEGQEIQKSSDENGAKAASGTRRDRRSLPVISNDYRNLDAAKIVRTLESLGARIEERFPDSGLAAVCHEMTELARQTQRRVDMISAPNVPLRVSVYLVIAISVTTLAILVGYYPELLSDMANSARGGFLDFGRLVQTVFYLVSMIAAAIIFLMSIEHRRKQRQTLRDLHELRSITHVIDMHQLTKDPGLVRGDRRSTLIVRRPMTKFELTRYFDYCSELLALTSKLAAIYAQHLPDPVVINAVTNIEMLTANLSREVWQKISILESYDAAAPEQNPRVTR